MEYYMKEDKLKFILLQNNQKLAFLKYCYDKDQDYIIESIFVEEAQRGEGLAKIVFYEFLKKVKSENKKVIPVCPYAKLQFQKSPEIQYLLKENIEEKKV